MVPSVETDTLSRTLNRKETPPAARNDGEFSTVRIYFREIGQYGCITLEEEIRLAKCIRAGDAGARQKMILANLRLVVKIALDYEGLGLPLLDLINEGNIGLMKAVERFNPAKGGKLSTYSSWWIKQSIKRALANQDKTIRLPVHLVEKISRMRRKRLNLLDQLDREPTVNWAKCWVCRRPRSRSCAGRPCVPLRSTRRLATSRPPSWASWCPTRTPSCRIASCRTKTSAPSCARSSANSRTGGADSGSPLRPRRRGGTDA